MTDFPEIRSAELTDDCAGTDAEAAEPASRNYEGLASESGAWPLPSLHGSCHCWPERIVLKGYTHPICRQLYSLEQSHLSRAGIGRRGGVGGDHVWQNAMPSLHLSPRRPGKNRSSFKLSLSTHGGKQRQKQPAVNIWTTRVAGGWGVATNPSRFQGKYCIRYRIRCRIRCCLYDIVYDVHNLPVPILFAQAAWEQRRLKHKLYTCDCMCVYLYFACMCMYCTYLYVYACIWNIRLCRYIHMHTIYTHTDIGTWG